MQSLLYIITNGYLKIQNIICILHEYKDNHIILAIEHVRDTDSNESSDSSESRLYNAYIYHNTFLLCKYLCIVQMK